MKDIVLSIIISGRVVEQCAGQRVDWVVGQVREGGHCWPDTTLG